MDFNNDIKLLTHNRLLKYSKFRRTHPKSLSWKERDFPNLHDFRPFSSQEKGSGDEFVGKQRVFQLNNKLKFPLFHSANMFL